MSYRILKTNVLASVLALSVLSVACSPTAPDPPPPPPPPVEVNYTLFGAVTEMTETGPVPVEGVRVTVSSTLSTMTDANGYYSIPGVRASNGNVTVIKDGYVQLTTPFSATADTRLDMRVARIVTYTLSGMAYEVTPAGRVPIAGIVLYCDSCGAPEGHTFITTDADGLYSFSWVQSATTYLQVMGKEGYLYVGPASVSGGGGHGPGVPIPTVGNTRFDVEFVRR